MIDIYDLLIKAKEGDKESEETIIINNINLVHSIVRRIVNTSLNKYDENDLFQIGVIGLIKAIKKFDLNRQVKFSTYAFPLILGEIKMYMREDGIVKISRVIKDNAKKINLLKERYIREGKGDITIDEIEKELNLTRSEIILAINSKNEIGSLDAIEDSNDDSKESDKAIINNIHSDINIEKEVVEKTLFEEILNKLSKLERQVIVLRYLNEEKQIEVGKILNITQVKVSRIEKTALNKLRKIFT